MNRFLVLVSASLAACAATACDICATHIALGSWQETGRLNLSLFSQFARFDAHEDEPELESLHSQLAAAWRFNDRWAVQAGVPYISRDLDGETTDGIGDATLIGIFRVHKSVDGADATLVDLYAGLKFPTGDTDELAEESEAAESEQEDAEEEHADEHAEGDEHEEHAHSTGHVVSPGSGSFDGIFGARALIKRGHWSANAGAQYVARTEGDHDYRYGNELILNAGVRRYLILGDDGYLALGADLSRDQRDQDEVLGEKQKATPASSYVGPVLEAAVNDQLSLFAAWEIAIEGENRGLHGAADQRARLGASFMF